jgi:hypothetical protein
MKFKKLKFLILILFFLPQYTLSNDKLEYFLYCNQIPEGSPFGLIFKDNEVAQIGIENFEKVLDYKENFRKKGNYFIWYNVTFNTKTLKLYIGNQEEHFAECKSVEGTFELNKLLELFLTNKKNKNTI